MAGMLVLLLSSLALGQDGVEGLQKCAAVFGVAARLACFDTIHDPEPIEFCGKSWAWDTLEVKCTYKDVTDLSPLSGLTGLGYLDLRGNKVSDLSPLSGLTGLTELRLGYTQVSDLSPLSGLTGLTRIGLFGTPVSDLSSAAGPGRMARREAGWRHPLGGQCSEEQDSRKWGWMSGSGLVRRAVRDCGILRIPSE